MKQGMTLQELAKEIERTESAKKDFVAPTTKLWTKSEDNQIRLDIDGIGNFGVNNHAHNQIANRLGIPKKYYDRMKLNAPDLLTTNINCWLRQEPETRMVRTLDGNVRAFLSDRYRPLDNYLVANAALPILVENGHVQVKSCQITETRMYLQAVYPEMVGEPKVGDIIQAGIVLSNSEVGAGSFRVEMLLYRLACLNGMIRTHSMKRYHVGKRIDTGEDVAENFYRQETREADDKAFMMKVQDTVRHSFNKEQFDVEIKLLADATENKIPAGKINDVIEEVTKRMTFSQKERDNVLSHLIENGDLSQYGLANAITQTANNHESYDRVIELERFGGQVIDLKPAEWSSLIT